MKMSDFDYKKYSLEQLENWVHDAVSGDATPQEIYDVIKGVVEEQYHYFKFHTGRCYEILALLNGNGKSHITCDRNDSSPECKNSWTSFWEKTDDGMRPWGHSDLEYKGSTVSSVKQDKVKRWVLPVEEVENGDTGEQEYFITFPDDLLEAANLKEGDSVEYLDRGDGSYILKKIENQMTYDEMISAGWTMTDDGFWIKE
jgi:hypothetical protein